MIDVLVIAPDAASFARQIEGIAGVAVYADAAALAAASQPAHDTVLVIVPPMVTQAQIDALPRLRWIQTLTSGTDGLATLRLPDDIVVSALRGIHGDQVSELVFFYMLSLLRDPGGAMRARTDRAWQPRPQPILAGKRIVIVGIGDIALTLAARCHPFGMHVTGVSDARTQAPGFDRVLPRIRLAEAAGEADFLVLLVPLDATTYHLIDRRILATMPPAAFLINVARGGVVDEAALTACLRSGSIAGAGLDVFEHEPLEPDSPFWTMPNVIVTPHIGGLSDVYAEQAGPILRENLRRWADGMRPLVNEIAAPHPGKLPTPAAVDRSMSEQHFV